MARIEGVKELIAKLRFMAKKYPNVRGMVGYTQSYAVYVHENLESFHPNGQAKYLEHPAREMAEDILDTIAQALSRGLPFEEALMLGCLFLQRESQLLVPVDTGALRASAFSRTEKV